MSSDGATSESVHTQESIDLASSSVRERIFYVANSLLASLLVSFVEPLKQSGPDREIESTYITEGELRETFGKDFAGGAARDWLIERLADFAPTLIVLCRYSGPHAPTIVAWARTAGVPTIFHVDDDLLNVPMELGASKHALHNHPDRIATVRYLLDEATLVYCSTVQLLRRFFGDDETPRAIAGTVYCTHEVLAEPSTDKPQVIGYMGSDHRFDFQLCLPALVRLLDERSELIFEMFGSTPIPPELERFDHRIRKVETVGDYRSFVEKLSTLGWTIGICALADTPFNAVKANTKWVEYTASGFAVVASRGGTYDRCCSDGCGELVQGDDEWLAAFEVLLDDPARHRAQVERAQARLRSDYSPARLVAQIFDVFDRARALCASSMSPDAATEPPPESAVALPLEPEPVTEAKPTTIGELYLDNLHGDFISGWAWSPEEASIEEAQRGRIELWCGDVRVGTCARTKFRVDVDAFVNDPVGLKGYIIPGGCLSALWMLFGQRTDMHPTLRFADREISLPMFSPIMRDLNAFRSLRSAEEGGNWRVKDVWWAGRSLLKVRTVGYYHDKTNRAAITLRVFQPVATSDGRLRLTIVDEMPFDGSPTIIPIGLRSQVMPILFTGTDEAGNFVFSDLVPFPSLLRGGVHESEVAAVGEMGGTLADILNLNDAYLSEAAGWGDNTPSFSVAGLSVDLRHATGAETVFDPYMRAWLSVGFGMPIRAENVEARVESDLGDSSFVTHALARLADIQPHRVRDGRGCLHLPCDAIPTIAAVVSRRLPIPAGQGTGPGIIVDEAFPNRRWLLTFPSESSHSGGAQLASDLDGQARLSAIDNPMDEPTCPSDIAVPLTIALRDLSPWTEAQKIFPIPKDQPNIVLASADGGAGGIVSVIVSVPRHGSDMRVLFESIASQITSHGCDIAICAANQHQQEVDVLRSIGREIFADNARILDLHDAPSVTVGLNQAAASAMGDVLIFVDAAMVLHDHRTIETLARIARRPGTGTVGCSVFRVRNEKDATLVLESSGYLPGRVNFIVAPHIGLVEQDCCEILPNAIYPVVANASHCFAVATATWRAIGGMDARRFPHGSAEIDLSLRLAELGYVNLCTTRLTALKQSKEAARTMLDVQVATNLGLWRMLPAIKASTLIRAF